MITFAFQNVALFVHHLRI